MAKGDDEKYVRAYSNYIIGIFSIIMGLITSWGIGGIILGIIGLVRVKKDKGGIAKKAKKLNLIGLIVGIVFFVVSVAYMVYSFGLNQGITY